MKAFLLGPQVGTKRDQKILQKLLMDYLELHPGALCVGVDGGTALWLKWGVKPTFAIGDWDSLGKQKGLLAQIPHVTLSTDKNRSDLFYAMVAAIEAGAQEIVCFGVTGGRPDHHLANLIDLSSFSSGKFGKLKSLQAKGIEGDYIFLSTSIPVWKSQLGPGTCLSLFALDGLVSGVTLKGFRYPLKNAELLPSSLGLSNLVVKRNCEVRLRKGRAVVIMPRNGCG